MREEGIVADARVVVCGAGSGVVGVEEVVLKAGFLMRGQLEPGTIGREEPSRQRRREEDARRVKTGPTYGASGLVVWLGDVVGKAQERQRQRCENEQTHGENGGDG